MKETITIFGQGKMGKALATYFEKQQFSIQFIGRKAEEIKGTIVILALPFETMMDTVLAYHDQLKEKVIIDISNPMDYQSKQSLLPPEQSVTLNLATTFPELVFLKAFNTNFSSSRVDAAEQPLVFLAGNQAKAKEFAQALFQKAGFRVLDIGPLENSRDLEAYARVQVHLLEAAKIEFVEGFAL